MRIIARDLQEICSWTSLRIKMNRGSMAIKRNGHPDVYRMFLNGRPIRAVQMERAKKGAKRCTLFRSNL